MFAIERPLPRKLRSLKAISDDGGFELRNPMRANATQPIRPTRAAIDRGQFHKPR